MAKDSKQYTNDQEYALARLLKLHNIQNHFHVSDDGHFHIELWNYDSVEKLIDALSVSAPL